VGIAGLVRRGVAHRVSLGLGLDSRHSRNIAERPEVALVIFDSTAAIGGSEAVYVGATVEELGREELERAISIYSRRSQEAVRASGRSRT
jgi:hypothetical protein